MSHFIVNKVLSELAAEGIVNKESSPPTNRFRVNRDHWVVKEILLPMFTKEAAWHSDIEKRIVDRPPKSVVSIILFGSFVKGGFGSESDIDVLVLIDQARSKTAVEAHFHERAAQVFQSFRHPLSVTVFTASSFARDFKGGHSLAREIVNTGRVIYGKLITEILFEI